MSETFIPNLPSSYDTDEELRRWCIEQITRNYASAGGASVYTLMKEGEQLFNYIRTNAPKKVAEEYGIRETRFHLIRYNNEWWIMPGTISTSWTEPVIKTWGDRIGKDQDLLKCLFTDFKLIK